MKNKPTRKELEELKAKSEAEKQKLLTETEHGAGDSSSTMTCSAPEAHKLINDRLEIRPFNKAGDKDGSWHYVHRCNAHQAVQIARREGAAHFAAWLTAEAEENTITPSLMLKMLKDYEEETNPITRPLKQNVKFTRPNKTN